MLAARTQSPRRPAIDDRPRTGRLLVEFDAECREILGLLDLIESSGIKQFTIRAGSVDFCTMTAIASLRPGLEGVAFTFDPSPASVSYWEKTCR